MPKRLALGVLLFGLGLALSSQSGRPFIDYNFHFLWFGFLLISDSAAYLIAGNSLFANWREAALLACSSSVFWWFYEWANLSLHNWAYPTRAQYAPIEIGLLATVAFVTVIPHLVISTNLISGALRRPIAFAGGRMSSAAAGTAIAAGVASLVLAILLPVYFFPLIWFVIFLLLDPINALAGRRSLIVEVIFNRNFALALVLAAAALYAGFWWETLNFVAPKWTYTIVPWFWNLPAPITTRFAQMPLAGFLGYIPFIYSAFAFVECIQLDVAWLSRRVGVTTAATTAVTVEASAS